MVGCQFGSRYPEGDGGEFGPFDPTLEADQFTFSVASGLLENFEERFKAIDAPLQ